MDGTRTAAAIADVTMSAMSRSAPERGTAFDPLIEAARSGDREAVDRLYAAVRPRLLRSALALGAGPDAAPDLVQEVLWSVHRNLARFDPKRGSFEGWVATILVRRISNARRTRVRRQRLLGAFRRTAPISIESRAGAVEARATLQRLLDVLTARQREVVALYDIAELGADETARALGMSPAGVRSIARDAHRKLERAARQDVPREDLP